MKIDANPIAGRPGGAAHDAGAQNGDRWLAQLEKACLGAWHAQSSPSRGDGAPAQASRERTPQAPPDAATETARGAAAPAPAAWSGLASMQAVLAPTAALQSAVSQQAYAGLAPSSEADPGAPSGDAVAEPVRAPAAGMPPASTRLRGTAVPTPDAGCGPPPAAVAPTRYARQFMQLSLSEPERAQASVRDASLSAANAADVARDIAARLRTDGVVLQRVFINGRRFDVGGSPVGRAAPPHDTNQTQE